KTSIVILPSVASSISSANFSAAINHVDDSLVVTDISKFISSSPLADEPEAPSSDEHALINNNTPNNNNKLLTFLIFVLPLPLSLFKLFCFLKYSDNSLYNFTPFSIFFMYNQLF